MSTAAPAFDKFAATCCKNAKPEINEL